MSARAWRKGDLVLCWWDRSMGQAPWTTVWPFLEKLNTELPYDPVILLVDTYLPKGSDNRISKRYLHPQGHSIIIEQRPQCGNKLYGNG